MHFPRLALISILSIISLSACTTIPPAQLPQTVTPDAVSMAIAQSAELISKSVLEMKLVTTAANLPDITPNKVAQLNAQNANVPKDLLPKISTEHDGPYTTLVRAIAQAVGWSYGVEGLAPPILQIVHKKYVDVRAIDALRDLGYTIHGATIVLDPVNKKIIVRF